MAGTTRFGFAGGRSDGPTPPEEPEGDAARPSRTLFGRDLHLRRSALDLPPAATPAPAVTEAPPAAAPRQSLARSRSMTPMGSGVRPRVPSHSGKSKLPALARLFRWNTQGDLTEDGADDEWQSDRETLVIPRNDYLRPALVVMATALVSFVLVMSLLRMRDRAAAPPPRPAPVAAPATLPAAPPPPTPAPAAARPAPPPTEILEPSFVAPRPKKPTAPVRRAAPPRKPRSDPDGVMPLRF